MKVITRTIINMVLLLTASVVAQSVASAEVSERLRIPDAQTLLLTAKGVGVQISVVPSFPNWLSASHWTSASTLLDTKCLNKLSRRDRCAPLILP